MVDLAVGGLGPGELVGGGASATVFAATRLAFGDRVAVKILKQTLTDAQSRSHFQREARALAELADIPGVVAVLDSGVNDRGEPYLILPLFQGSAQSDVNSQGPMDPQRAARILSGAARAVHGGHQRGVIHRDLKPANLLLTKSDDIFVSDFGIAKLTDSSASASGWLGLTPAYAPPEALEGISGGVAGDVYSLGATLAALIIGAPPFSSTGSESPIALLNRVVNEPAPDMVAHGAPPAIAAVVAKAMAKAPADRHATALEFAEALEAANSGGRTVAPSPSVTAELDRPAAAPPAAAPPPPAAAPAPPAAAPPPPAAAPPPPAAAPAPPAAAPPPPAAAPAPPAAAPPPPAAAPPPPAAVPAPQVAAASAAQGPVFEPPPVLAASQAAAPPLIPPPAQTTTGDDNNKKVALGVGAAVAAVAIIGGFFAFRGGGETTAPPEPTAVVAEPTAVPAATAAPAPTAEPTAEPVATVVPTATPAPAPTAVPQATTVPLPPAVSGGPIDVYPDGSGEAVDLASAVRDAVDGDIIRLSPGVHEIDDLIFIDRNISIIGAGADQTMIMGHDNSVIFVEDTTGLTLRGFTVTSDFVDETEEDDNRGAIQLIGATDFVVEGVAAIDHPGFGFVAVDSTGYLTNSTFTNSLNSGAVFVGNSDVQASNNTVTGSGDSGFVWFGESSGTALGNTSTGNGIHGFTVEEQALPALVGNTATENVASGFRMFEDSAAVLHGNRSSANEESGFAWFGNAVGTAEGNVGEGNGLSGFIVSEQAAPDLFGNSGLDNGEAGFVWLLESSGTVSANRAERNGIDGFAILDDSTVALRANFGSGNSNDLFLNETSSATIDEGGVVRVELDGSGDTDDLASAVARSGAGDVVLVGPGNHEVPESVAIDRDLTIVGDSAETTTVNVESENTALLVDAAALTLRDITLTSTFEPTTDDDRFSVVEMDQAQGFIVDNVVIRDSPGIGLGIFESTGSVTNSTFTDNFWSGMGLAERSDVTVVGNTLTTNGQSGLVFFDAARGSVGANEASGNVFFGFSVQGSGDPDIVGNVSSGNESSGFAMSETASASIIGNISTNNGTAGFVWFDTSSGVAIANTSTENESSGFGISEQATPTVSFNSSLDNEVDGFTWFENSSGSAFGNLATGNGLDGFAAEDESTPDLTKNVSRDNDRRSFNRAADANPVLTDNEFD